MAITLPKLPNTKPNTYAKAGKPVNEATRGGMAKVSTLEDNRI
jgi:hypothetical protein